MLDEAIPEDAWKTAPPDFKQEYIYEVWENGLKLKVNCEEQTYGQLRIPHPFDRVNKVITISLLVLIPSVDMPRSNR